MVSDANRSRPFLKPRAMTVSETHLVILPTYNTGPRLRAVVAEVLRHWQPVLVVVDGSTDGSADDLGELAKSEPQLRVLVLPHNMGKGAAVLAGTQAALERGFTHALVMDADGQHPAGSIAEFMSASCAHPAALVLGRPIFPANIPAERLHGRKLSVGLVRLEILGEGIADPLFGFRVYPLAALQAALGSRRGGRRYDFDTEAAVRLCWAGVPPLNLAAPVKYFSRAEGGVSHFHYLRDNAVLVWLHTRLLAELLLWRWPAVRRQQRRRSGLAGLAVALLFVWVSSAGAADSLVNPGNLLPTGAPGWTDLTAAFAHRTDTTAEFTERRFFPFKKKPVELVGEVRVSATRGLSLHYTSPEDRTVILDDHGTLVRGEAGERELPADPRARAANEALRHVLRFDFAALEKDFEIYGRRDGNAWALTLIARTAEGRQGIGTINVSGEGPAVRRIELRHSAKQSIEILNSPPRPTAPFTVAELKRYFR